MSPRFLVPARRGRLAVLSFAAVLVVSAAAQADGPVFYSGGRAHPLIRSETEFAVEIDPAVRTDMVGAGLLEKAGGLLKAVPGTRRIERHAILEVAQATPEARQAAAKATGVKSVRPVYRFRPDGSPMMSTGELVAKVRPGLTDARRAEMFAEYGFEVVRPVRGLAGVYVLRPTGADDDEVAAAAALHGDRRVVYAHPDFRVKAELYQASIRDVFFGEQWHLQNSGQSGGRPGADINVRDAWDITMGAGVRVGMFDAGCDLTHEDLKDNYLGTSHDAGTGEVSPTAANPQYVFDTHGTSVMGLIVAEANDIGVRGVAPEAQFVASTALENALTFSDMATPYPFAQEQNVDVHNNSWGFGRAVDPPVIVDAIQSAFENGRNGLGMVILFASGNDGTELELGYELSTLPTVIGVGGSTANDGVSVGMDMFGMHFGGSNYGPDIDVLAPTNILDPGLPNIVTTDVTDGVYTDFQGFAINGYNNGGFFIYTGEVDLPEPAYTMFFNGTSAACPITTGLAALVLSANPGLTATQVRLILEHTAVKIASNATDPEIEPAEYDGITSRSLKYGYGRINATAAVDAAVASLQSGLTWPDRVANVIVNQNLLLWESNDDLRGASQAGDRTEEFLVVESVGTPFAWTPVDEATYSLGEEVEAFTLAGDPLLGVRVASIGTSAQYQFTTADSSTSYFAILARNGDGRYSWGVSVDSKGNVKGAVDKTPELPTGPTVPRVNVVAVPVSGTSPLTVDFWGNAQTDNGVASEEWDFGDGATDTRSTTSHTYTVPAGTSQTFTASFTVVDVDGLSGSKSVAISVTSPVDGNTNDNGASDDTAVTMILTDSEGAALNTSRAHPAPLRVYFSVDVSRLTLDVSRVVWSFGDGSDPEEGLSATHVYETAGSFAAAVEVYVQTSSGVEVGDPYSDYEVIPVSADPNANANANVNDNTGGGTVTPGGSGSGGVCGLGILMPFAGVMLMTLGRRRPR